MKATPKKIVVIGALSAIARGVAQAYAEVGSEFFLVARREHEVVELANQLRQLGAGRCSVYVTDLRQRDVHDEIVTNSLSELGTIDLVLLAQGVYPPKELLRTDVDVMLDSFMVNAVTVISVMHRYGAVIKNQRSGMIAVISSVAGDRGRANNYQYGSAKSAVSAFASGQRAELAEYGGHVITIKPGPVATPMTTHEHVPLMATVKDVVPDIVAGIEHRKTVVYTPWIWRIIMVVIRSLPERLFMKVRR